jgi:hypothetical protein
VVAAAHSGASRPGRGFVRARPKPAQASNNPLYTEISLPQWLAANPARLLEDNFGVTSEMIDKLPKAALGIAK